jgi:anti-sigma regulatory factor (Ser/Thr protein kinase)
MENKKIKHFVIENKIAEIPVLAEKIDDLASEWDLSPALAMNINLVIEEAISNIIFYAFNDKAKHEIKISISINNKKLVIEITDDGIPFDPLSLAEPDITLPAEERPIGGLGIFLITQLMDEVNYKRQKNRNLLTLIKKN